MSAIQIQISDQEMAFLEVLADKSQCTLPEAASRVIAEAARAQREWEYLLERAEQGRKISAEEYQAILAKVPDVPPVPGDELPEGWNGKVDKH